MSTKFKFQLVLLFAVLAAAIALFPGSSTSLPKGIKPPAKKTVYYKWQDEQGHWHMSDTAPEGIDAQQLETHPDANILPSIATPAKQDSTDKPATTTPPSAAPLEYLKRAQQTLQDAKQAAELLNQRQHALDEQNFE